MATTKITKGKSFSAAVRCDLENGLNKSDREKIERLPATKSEGLVAGFEEGKRARLLATNLIEGDNSELAEQFEEVAKQHSGIKEPVHKVAISIKPGEHLETHQWLEVGRSYLEEMGYKDCPFLIAQHREKDHEHIHILTSRIDFNGDVVSDSFEKKRARKWAQSIEEKYDLSRTEEKASEKGLTRAEIEQSVKTGKIPARIFLQETVHQTLEKYRETASFVEALEKQNVSVMVRTKANQEIVGVSFGHDGKYFKGSNLGSNFTWNKLQERGLNYELQRDYAKLEEASQRASRGKLEFSRIGQPETKSLSNSENLDVSDGLSESDRFSSQQSGRAERQGTFDSRSGTEKTIGAEYSAVQSVSDSATENERDSSETNSEFARGNETEFRRVGHHDSGYSQTAERTESANQTFEDIAIPIIEFEFDGSNEYFKQVEDERLSELFDQLPAGSRYFEPIDTENTSTRIDTSTFGEPQIGAETETTALDESNGNTYRGSILADYSNISGNMGNDQNDFLACSTDTGISVNDSFSGIHNNSFSGFLFRDNLSLSGNTHDAEKIKDLSLKLRQSLNDIKEAVEETIVIQDAIKNIEIKHEQKCEEIEDKIEIEKTISLMM